MTRSTGELVMRHRAEDHAVRLFGRFDGALGKGLAFGAQRSKADRNRRERQAQAEGPLGGAEHIHGRRGDLGPDAVPLHDDKPDKRG